MTFPGARQFGASLLASAGVVGLVAGIAARPVFGNLIAGLQQAGMSDGDIRKVLGTNLLRVWTAVEDGAEH